MGIMKILSLKLLILISIDTLAAECEKAHRVQTDHIVGSSDQAIQKCKIKNAEFYKFGLGSETALVPIKYKDQFDSTKIDLFDRLKERNIHRFENNSRNKTELLYWNSNSDQNPSPSEAIDDFLYRSIYFDYSKFFKRIDFSDSPTEDIYSKEAKAWFKKIPEGELKDLLFWRVFIENKPRTPKDWAKLSKFGKLVKAKRVPSAESPECGIIKDHVTQYSHVCFYVETKDSPNGINSRNFVKDTIQKLNSTFPGNGDIITCPNSENENKLQTYTLSEWEEFQQKKLISTAYNGIEDGFIPGKNINHPSDAISCMEKIAQSKLMGFQENSAKTIRRTKETDIAIHFDLKNPEGLTLASYKANGVNFKCDKTSMTKNLDQLFQKLKDYRKLEKVQNSLARGNPINFRVLDGKNDCVNTQGYVDITLHETSSPENGIPSNAQPIVTKHEWSTFAK